jgi:hypothetical protein
MWLPNMHRLGPNISTSDIIQGFNCSSFQFMPKMHSTAEMLTQVLPTLQPLWVRHQIGPWSEAAKRSRAASTTKAVAAVGP